jgi:hypothetical protein
MSFLQDDLAYYGVVHGCYYGQQEREDEINQRIYERIQPHENMYDPLQVCIPKPQLYPMSTKYQQYPMLEEQKKPKKPYQISSSYDHSIDIENELGNRQYRYGMDTTIKPMTEIYGRANIHASYVPSIHSTLYHVPRPTSQDHILQPFPLLFQQETYTTTENTYISKNTSNHVFHQCTKQCCP